MSAPRHPRVAIYARVSTPRGKDLTKDGQERQHTENQVEVLRQFISEHKAEHWRLVRTYEDRDTGSTDDRPQFQLMMREATLHHFDILLFWSLDRLTREGALKTLSYLNQLSSLGIGYRSWTEQYLDTCGLFKDAVIAILAVIAQQERVRHVERVKAGLDRVRAQGVKLGNKEKPVDRAHFERAMQFSTTAQLGQLFGISRSKTFQILHEIRVKNQPVDMAQA